MPHDSPVMTLEEFETLPLDELAARTGLTAPESPTPEEERAWRMRAYEDYRVDVENAEEWGNARQGESSDPPED